MEKERKIPPKTSFEEALHELEEVAMKLEGGELGLDESIKEFERGIRLAAFCQQKLDEAERKIEILQKGTDGIVKSQRIAVKSDTGEVEEGEDMQGSLI